MKNQLEKALINLTLTKEKLSMLDLDLLKQQQAKIAQEKAWAANKCSGIKGTYINEEGKLIFKI